MLIPPSKFEIFITFPIFQRLLGLKSFINSWGNFYTGFVILDIKYHFTWDESGLC